MCNKLEDKRLKWRFRNMIRVTLINGSYYCESGRTSVKLKRDSFDRNGSRRRLNTGEIVTFQQIHENDHGKWIKVRTKDNLVYDVRMEDLIYQKEHLRR